ncbi:hypothetical protein M0O70_20050, partial [Acinetobacter lactucae]|nr:hypothetical protein [Acinetobacter lactucae]
MNNAAHQFANKVVAQYQFTNGSDSSLNHLIIGNSTAEIIDTLIYMLFSSHAETYDDGVVWFKSVDAINVEKSYITYNSRENCIFAYFVFDKNPLMLGEFKHEVRQFQKPYDNQQAEQISLM